MRLLCILADVQCKFQLKPYQSNTYFATIGTKLDKKIPTKNDINRPVHTINNNIIPLSQFHMITVEQLMNKEISNICVYKSSGIMGIMDLHMY